MSGITYFVTTFVLAVLRIVQILMLLRVILSWFGVEENSFSVFIYHVTEIFVSPVRSLLERSEKIRLMPIDLSFFLTFILLSLLETVIGFL
ncbi:MAG: YggT family protein [Clostridia bacterium]|nr:YggT family protein [Clostridia bacterium]